MSIEIDGIKILNLALDRLEEEPIESITAPTTKTEKLAARVFDKTRRSTLRKHPWNFATAIIRLAARTDTVPDGEWDAWYNLPSDYIRLCRIGVDDYFRDRYDIVGNQLLVRDISGVDASNTIVFKYVYDFTNYPKADPLFLDLLILELALVMADKLTGKSSLKDSIMEEIKLVKSEAFAIDGQDRPPRRIERSKFLLSRKGRGSYGGRSHRAYFGDY